MPISGPVIKPSKPIEAIGTTPEENIKYIEQYEKKKKQEPKPKQWGGPVLPGEMGDVAPGETSMYKQDVGMGDTLSWQQMYQESWDIQRDISGNLSRLQQMKEGIDVEEYYSVPGRPGYYPGSTIIREYIDPNIEVLESQLSEQQQITTGLTNFDRRTVFVRNVTGYKIIPYDSSLDWSRSEIKKGESLPPILKELYMFGFSFASTTASFLKPAFEAFSTPRVDFIGRNVYVRRGLPKTNVHFLSPTDVAFEPFGLAPKGSSELIGRMGPAGWAGGLVSEASFMYGAGKIISPVSGWVKTTKPYKYASGVVNKGFQKAGTRISSFSSRISSFSPFYQKYFHSPIKSFVFQSPKRYGLEGAMVTVGRASNPLVSGELSVMSQTTERGIGLGRMFGFRKTTEFTRPLIGFPTRLESGRWIYGTSSMWMHKGGPTYRALVKGFATGGMGLGFDPMSQQISITSGKIRVSEPFGVLGRKIKITQEITGKGYGYLTDDVYNVLSKNYGNVFKVGEPIQLWRPYSFQGSGKYISQAPTMGELSFTQNLVSGGFFTGGGLSQLQTMTIPKQFVMWIPRRGVGPWLVKGGGKIGGRMGGKITGGTIGNILKTDFIHKYDFDKTSDIKIVSTTQNVGYISGVSLYKGVGLHPTSMNLFDVRKDYYKGQKTITSDVIQTETKLEPARTIITDSSYEVARSLDIFPRIPFYGGLGGGGGTIGYQIGRGKKKYKYREFDIGIKEYVSPFENNNKKKKKGVIKL